MLKCYLWNGPNLYSINFESLTLTFQGNIDMIHLVLKNNKQRELSVRWFGLLCALKEGE